MGKVMGNIQGRRGSVISWSLKGVVSFENEGRLYLIKGENLSKLGRGGRQVWGSCGPEIFFGGGKNLRRCEKRRRVIKNLLKKS